MSRRRLMMLQQSKPDLLEGYRIDSADGRYRIMINWLSKDEVQINHYRDTFMGSSMGAKNFVGTQALASSSLSAIVPSATAMTNLELGKTYRLTITVTEVLQNDATAENDGQMWFGIMGKGSSPTERKNFSEMVVGTKFVVEKVYSKANDYICGAAMQANTPTIMWNFKFKVEFEEV